MQEKLIPREVIHYLEGARVGVIALELLDGSIHGATVHFAFTENPFTFYFQTFNDSKKADLLTLGKAPKASFVVGTDESTMQTLQLDGIADLVQSREKELCEMLYLAKFPEKKDRAFDPRSIYFKFTPKWWRFSDFKNPKGKLILSSE
jgi:general stress protein 26